MPFYSRYMVTVMPRYMLIDPEGRIVDVDAPKPSSSAKLLFKKCGRVINFFVYLSMFTGVILLAVMYGLL